MTKEQAAAILTALCRRKLAEAGLPHADFAVSADEVLRAMAAAREEGVGGGGLNSDRASTSEAPNGRAVGTSIEVTSIGTSGTSSDTSSTPELEEQVVAVWAGWRELLPKAVAEPDAKSRRKIAERLADGFSVAELVEACGVLVREPHRVGKTKVTAISRPLESRTRVCNLLGKEPPARQTWLTPYKLIWERHHPQGDLDFAVLAKVLLPIKQKHGDDSAQLEFDAYCSRTSPQYVSWPAFARAFGSWRSAPVNSRTDRGFNAADAVRGL